MKKVLVISTIVAGILSAGPLTLHAMAEDAGRTPAAVTAAGWDDAEPVLASARASYEKFRSFSIAASKYMSHPGANTKVAAQESMSKAVATLEASLKKIDSITTGVRKAIIGASGPEQALKVFDLARQTQRAEEIVRQAVIEFNAIQGDPRASGLFKNVSVDLNRMSRIEDRLSGEIGRARYVQIHLGAVDAIKSHIEVNAAEWAKYLISQGEARTTEGRLTRGITTDLTNGILSDSPREVVNLIDSLESQSYRLHAEAIAMVHTAMQEEIRKDSAAFNALMGHALDGVKFGILVSGTREELKELRSITQDELDRRRSMERVRLNGGEVVEFPKTTSETFASLLKSQADSFRASALDRLSAALTQRSQEKNIPVLASVGIYATEVRDRVSPLHGKDDRVIFPLSEDSPVDQGPADQSAIKAKGDHEGAEVRRLRDLIRGDLKKDEDSFELKK